MSENSDRKVRLGRDRISRLGVAIEIGFLLAAIVLFNAFPHKVGVYIAATDAHSFVPLLGPGFRAYLPYLNVLWSLALCLALAKLAYGRWTVALRWADLSLCLVGIGVLARLLSGSPISGLNPEWLAAPAADLGLPSAWASHTVGWSIAAALGLALLGLAVAAVTKFVRLLPSLKVQWGG